jgi:HIP---CoA ligase
MRLGFHLPHAGQRATARKIVEVAHADDPPEIVANWSCKPLPGIEVKLVDDDKLEVAFGKRGEVLVRGYNVSNGYYDEPEVTATVFQAEEWLRTGDIAS